MQVKTIEISIYGYACVNIGRKFIGIEMDDKYFEIAKERIENADT